MLDEQQIELEPSAGKAIRADPRRQMDEPPPVWLNSVADVRVPVNQTRAELLDGLYVDVLKFVRVPGELLTYRAENFDLIFDPHLPPVERDGIAPTRLLVPSLYVLRKELSRREITFDYARGLNPGEFYLTLQDPAGTWLEISDRSPLR